MRVKLPLLYFCQVLLDIWEEDSIVKLDDVAVGSFFLVGNFDFVDQSLVLCWLEPVDLLESSDYFVELDGQTVSPEDKVGRTQKYDKETVFPSGLRSID